MLTLSNQYLIRYFERDHSQWVNDEQDRLGHHYYCGEFDPHWVLCTCDFVPKLSFI